MVSEATIEVSGLRKRFGTDQALDGMTFTVQPGRVTGFVGPNGAGKSTTIRVILGLDAPGRGHAPGRRTALPAACTDPLRHVGRCWMPPPCSPSRTGRNHLLWLARSQEYDGPPGRRGDRTGRT